MNREILFRGKRIDNGEWVVVDKKKGNVYFYNSFSAALIGGICAMYKCNSAAPYIMRMLGVKGGEAVAPK